MAHDHAKDKKAASACPPRVARVLGAQYRAAVVDPHPHLLALVDEADVRVWYYLVAGLGAPFEHGEYIFRLTAPDSFPQRPPRLEFCTANGVFEPGGPVCLSVGEFHADDRPGQDGAHGWRPSLGMRGFAAQVVNGLICHEGLSGIRILSTPPAIKTARARASREANRREHPGLYARFEALAAARPAAAPARELLAARARLAPPAPDTPAPDTPAAGMSLAPP